MSEIYLVYDHNSVAYLKALRQAFLELYNAANQSNMVPKKSFTLKEWHKRQFPMVSTNELIEKINKSPGWGIDKEVCVIEVNDNKSEIVRLKVNQNIVNAVLNLCLRGHGRFYFTWISEEKNYRKCDLQSGQNEDVFYQILDFAAIPALFEIAYFGYDTGIDGLNELLKGGLLLPPDGPAYLVVGGESGVGKTNFTLKLILSIYQKESNGFHKSFSCPMRNRAIQDSISACDDDKKTTDRGFKITSLNPDNHIEIEYMLIEQQPRNLQRVINKLNMLQEPDAIEIKQNNQDQNRYSVVAKGTKQTMPGITFHAYPMYSSSDMISLIQDCEKEHTGKGGKRKIYVIDSINALLDANIDEQDWRQVFQAVKAVTRNSNSIVIFIHEKSDKTNTSIIEFLADQVIHIYREIQEGEVWRSLEVAESRFQPLHTGRHPFFINQHNDEAFSVYPLTSAVASIIPLQLAEVKPDNDNKEYGIKIEGILNYYEYCHNKKYDMEPFFFKNTVTLLDGDRGCHKTAFAYRFAESAFRDEVWASIPPNKQCEIQETNYKVNPPNTIIKEIGADVNNHTEPLTKCIGMIVHIGETYGESSGQDIVWDTFFGKVIFPNCKKNLAQKEEYSNTLMGQISSIICFFELLDYSEEVYFSIIWSMCRAVKTFNVTDEIPQSYEEFIKRAQITKVGEVADSKTNNSTKSCLFNPTFKLYNDTSYLHKNKPIWLEEVKEFLGCNSRKDEKIWVDHTQEQTDEIWCKYYKQRNYTDSDDSIVFYTPVRIARIAMDNCENLVNLFPGIKAKNLLSIVSHFCSTSNISLMVVNTIDYGDNNEITEICQAIADNVIQFRKVNLLGNWYPTMRISRSIKSLHNEAMFHIYKRKDGLLELLDSFSLIKNFDGCNHELLPIRIFAPQNSKEFNDYIDDLDLELNRRKVIDAYQTHCGIGHISKGKGAVTLTTNDNTKGSITLNFESISCLGDHSDNAVNQWHNYLKEMISASLSHMEVNIVSKSYSISDVSIVLDNESIKDAVTLMVIPGHLLHRYMNNLLVISDYINFYDKPAYNYEGKFKVGEVWVDQKSRPTLLKFDHKKGKSEDKAVFGKSYHFMHESKTKIKSDSGENYVVPDQLFNPALERYPLGSKEKHYSHGYAIRMKDVPDKAGKDILKINGLEYSGRVDVKAYPFYIDPRIDLIISSAKNGGELTDSKADTLWNNHTAEDYFVSYIEQLMVEPPVTDELIFLNRSKDLVKHLKDLVCTRKLPKEYKDNPLIIRDWYSAHQEMINTILRTDPDFFSKLRVAYRVPLPMIYQTWYLGVPQTSPRKDLACEIMVKMTEPHDMETLKILGIGLPVNEGSYHKFEKKYFPELEYQKVKSALASNAIPISYMLCYYKLITPIGGAVRNIAQSDYKRQKDRLNANAADVKALLKSKIKRDIACNNCLLKSRCPIKNLLEPNK